ncbi:hypothetical protein JAO71_04385 [Olleya sp. YSTF-M6]|uniref:DUF6705 domain-containing protein n=1 Tax=Olleya sediminilitoris TaxID=2795739 RepID=A0ABS1WIS8_9FLAO|nr:MULTISPECIES: DUF6705 family protein [Olleya]MBL7559034.1 hypothetical protein [Olleya sediminilitoris]
MKKILILTLTISSFFACKAQTIYGFDTEPEAMEANNIYIKDTNNDHDLIVGTWRWEDSNNSFEITLQEFEMYNYPDTSTRYYDAIFGKYKYIVDGDLISETTTIESLPNFSIGLNHSTSTLYSVVIEDVVSGKSMIGEFEIISSNTGTLNLWRSEGIRVNSPDDNGIDFSLPMSVTLTKQ